MLRRQVLIAFASIATLTACMGGQEAGTVMQTGSTFEAPSGKALVVFYRPAAFAGAATRFNVQHTDGPVGQLTSGAVIQKVVNPGENTFWAQAISQDSITIQAQAGQTYYIRGDVRMGIYAGRPQFTQVSETTALQDMSR
ncbi:DUF2846 domain-containing protein [Ruegeria arenilitoris]|uniref:DUF2846 domain-containing protein n=1 Tax=Ruegeria arenilitoris TaxID=1173585 RepID=UPI00147E15A7|nr:DUF2846 domain-containing protein [Ruegeria arenilitoris]